MAEAHRVERFALQALPKLGEPFDVVVARRVSRDCLVAFEGRRYSVPFLWVGREVEVMGTLSEVVIRAAGGAGRGLGCRYLRPPMTQNDARLPGNECLGERSIGMAQLLGLRLARNAQ